VNNHVPGNCRLDALQAAAIRAQLPDLNHRIRVRRKIAERYDGIVGQFAIPRMPKSNTSVYSLCHPQRDKLKHDLLNVGIQTAIYYPTALSNHPLVKEKSHCPNAERFCQTALSLPCHGGLSESAVKQVLAALNLYF
jgi:dTDP-4-amino-4,6-dideoxygalactose transaminase